MPYQVAYDSMGKHTGRIFLPVHGFLIGLNFLFISLLVGIRWTFLGVTKCKLRSNSHCRKFAQISEVERP